MAQIIEDDPNNRVIYDTPDREVYTGYSPFARFIWTILWIVNGLLAIRFLLRLFSANPGAGFTSAIYNVTAPLLAPFRNVLPATTINGIGIWEWSTLLAMVIYWLIAYLIVRLVTISRPVARY